MSQTGIIYDYDGFSERNSGLGYILIWDTFHFWMDGDPIPFPNFWIGMSSVVVQFWNWTKSGMGCNIYAECRFSFYVSIQKCP
jgi:hypothetical protein